MATNHALAGGAPRRPSVRSAATPRAISALAAAASGAASSIDGRNPTSAYGRLDTELKYGDSRDAAHGLRHRSASKPSAKAPVSELQSTAYGIVQASARAYVAGPKRLSMLSRRRFSSSGISSGRSGSWTRSTCAGARCRARM